MSAQFHQIPLLPVAADAIAPRANSPTGGGDASFEAWLQRARGDDQRNAAQADQAPKRTPATEQQSDDERTETAAEEESNPTPAETAAAYGVSVIDVPIAASELSPVIEASAPAIVGDAPEKLPTDTVTQPQPQLTGNNKIKQAAAAKSASAANQSAENTPPLDVAASARAIGEQEVVKPNASTTPVDKAAKAKQIAGRGKDSTLTIAEPSQQQAAGGDLTQVDPALVAESAQVVAAATIEPGRLEAGLAAQTLETAVPVADSVMDAAAAPLDLPPAAIAVGKPEKNAQAATRVPTANLQTGEAADATATKLPVTEANAAAVKPTAERKPSARDKQPSAPLLAALVATQDVTAIVPPNLAAALPATEIAQSTLPSNAASEPLTASVETVGMMTTLTTGGEPTPSATESAPTPQNVADQPKSELSRDGLIRHTGLDSANAHNERLLNDIERIRFVQRVARAMHTSVERGGDLSLRLSPPELGSLRLNVQLREGVMQVHLEAETPAAKSVLLENLPTLRDRLAEQNIRIEKFDVDLRQPGDEPTQHRFADGAFHEAHRGKTPRTVKTSGANVNVDAASQPTSRVPRSDGQLNVIV